MRRFQGFLCLLCTFLMAAGSLPAQMAIKITPPNGRLGWLTRPYKPSYVPEINLNNSDRLQALVRGGNLYLSVQDVIALALENNLDIEIQRYNPLLQKEVTKRTEGGGQLRSVGTGVAQGPQSVSLTGVSLTSSALSAANSGVSSSGLLTSLGPAVPSFDPQLFLYGNFGHYTSPLSNTVLTGTTELINSQRTYEAQYSQYSHFGTFWQLTYAGQWNRYNSARYNINPYFSGDLDFQISQNLLQGFGRSVLTRFIRISKNNEKVSDLTFKLQVITTASAVLNLYWDLVSFYDDVRARKNELATAQALYEDNKKQVQIGTLAPIEVTRAEAQVYSSQQDLLIAQTNLLQQETVLKNALSRNGVASPLLREAHIVPLDRFSIPPKDELKPLNELVQEALNNRVEIKQARINLESTKINLNGIKNSLKPSLQVFAELTNNGLSGQPNPLAGLPPSEVPSILQGGYGNFLGQIFRRNYPSYSAGLSLSIPLRNRTNQADYAINALELRQNELQLQKAINQIRVDVQNAVVGVQQARAQYDSAVKARILQQQTLDADKKRYALGATTVFQVVQDEQALAAAQTAEVEALANYTHARIAFDQAIGTTLEVNHINIHEALEGRVSRPSILPSTLPQGVE